MEVKKSSKADLEKGKAFGYLMGIIIGLAVLFVGFEWGTVETEVAKTEGVSDLIMEEEIEITSQEEAPPPPPPPAAPPQQEVAAEILTIVEDNMDVGTQSLMSTEDSQAAAQVQTYVPPAATTMVAAAEEEEEHQIFVIVEKQPEFPGGDLERASFLQKNIKYPVVAQENGIQGRVTCQFVVNTDGSIVDIEVVRGVDPLLDKEAIRVIGTMPKWTPGEQRGKPVRVRFTLPVNFRLQQQ